MQAFSRAADGIRTHDLLHGKQYLSSTFAADTPCKSVGSRVGASFCDSPAFTASSRGFRHPIGTRTLRLRGAPHADAGRIGQAGPGPGYLDDDSGGPDNDFTNRNTMSMTYQADACICSMFLVTSSMVWPSYLVGLNSTTSVPAYRMGVWTGPT